MVEMEDHKLTVWYGKMPESNGRENWTATLRRVNPTDKWDHGFCFARSEYPERVRYEADSMRWIIGELAEKPDILAYDADLHSGYVPPPPVVSEEIHSLIIEIIKENVSGYGMDDGYWLINHSSVVATTEALIGALSSKGVLNDRY